MVKCDELHGLREPVSRLNGSGVDEISVCGGTISEHRRSVDDSQHQDQLELLNICIENLYLYLYKSFLIMEQF